MKKVALHNLGCKVNAYETEYMSQLLKENGYEIVSFNEKADIYVINTCTVTNIADRKSRQMLHRARQLNPESTIVAAGCYVQVGGEKVLDDDAVDICIGNNIKKDIVKILDEYFKGEGKKNEVPDIGSVREYEEITLKQSTDHTRCYIKIQDGCNQFCSYCEIPFARGRVRSRHMKDVVNEIEGVIKNGCREVVLTGIHLSSYGIDLTDEEFENLSSEAFLYSIRGDYGGRSRIIELLERIDRIEGLCRVRIGSLEPRIITKENAERLSKLSKLCPHFHLSLQSGCEATLKRMNRHYTPEEYLKSVEILRTYFDNPAITTDVIVGFPGETMEEFNESLEFVKKVHFYEIHIFKYSKRAGTRAAVMPGQLSEAEKAKRSDIMFEVEKKDSYDYRARLIGKSVPVLFEEIKSIDGEDYYIGHTQDYVLTAIRVSDREGDMVNQIKTVRIEKMLNEEVLLAESS